MADKRLKVWADPEATDEPPAMHRPMPGEVLYTQPNSDNTRKSCHNCTHWISVGQECFLFDADVVVPADAICGYHIFGRPYATAPERSLQTVDPEFAGFDHVRGGTSCDRCAFYKRLSPADGTCSVVVDPDEGNDYTVAALGCCTMWVEHG